jgi:hypothetical protein
MDPHVGQVIGRDHDVRPGYYQNQTYDGGKTYWPIWIPESESWSLTIRWSPQRFRDDDSGKVRTEPADTDSTDVGESTYDACSVGQWFNEDNGRCGETSEVVSL